MKSEIINPLMITDKFVPKQSIIIYENSDSKYYLESHDIIAKDDKYQWQEGRPVLKETLQKLSTELGNESFAPMKINGLLPDNLLFIRQAFLSTSLVWYLPPGKHQLKFINDLNIENDYYSTPGLIFIAHDRNLYITAYKGKEKPTIKTQLFKAPFHNMHPDAQVCLGNIKEGKSKSVVQDEMKRWERRFFNSNFTHFLDSKVVKGNLQLIFKSIKNKASGFPSDKLVGSKYKTLDKFIKTIINE